MKRVAIPSLLLLILNTSSFAQVDSSFKPSGRIIAQFFMDYFYQQHATELRFGSNQYSGIQRDYASFDIRRLFLGYNYDFTSSFTCEILLSYEGNLDGSGNRGFLLKVADIRWKDVFHNSDFLIGLQFTPAFVLLTEKIWGYRSIEKTVSDKNKLEAPTDLGAGLQGTFDDDKNFGYDVLYADGTGTKPETDRYKKLYADLWAKLLDKKIVIDIYGDFNKAREIPSQTYTTLKLFAAYQMPALTFGVEAFIQNQTKTITVADTFGILDFADASPFGISLFIRGEIIENKLNFFARYDRFDPDRDFNYNLSYLSPGYSTFKDDFITFGLDWTPYPAIHIMPNIWYEGYHNKIPVFTGTALYDYDLVPRVTFAFKY